MSDEDIRKIEQNTREQRQSTRWHSVRRYRITASKFVVVAHRKPDTPPDSLVLSILQPRQFTSAATEWGIEHEPAAIERYVKHHQTLGNVNTAVGPCGFYISKSHPYLGASPDAAVYDPSMPSMPFGFLEVKCPYTHRNSTSVEACSGTGFFCTMQVSTGCRQVTLRTNHLYYSQVQGQMAIGNREWCDFVVYTNKDISMQRIKFDQQYWNNDLLPKLTQFYDNCLGLEIMSPVHDLGLPVYNLKDKYRLVKLILLNIFMHVLIIITT